MSLFVAIRPAEEAIAHLAAVLDPLQASMADGDLHWQSPDRWHVTLAFLGDIDASTIARLTGRLEALGSTRAAPGPVQLASAGVFSGQVLWVGVTGLEQHAGAGLSALAAAVRSAASREHVDLDHRRWRPHLTVARDRRREQSGDSATGAQSAAVKLDSYSGPAWFVDDIRLVESTGGPHPAHTVLHRTHLARASQ